MKKSLLPVFCFVASCALADPISWSVQPLKLGRVDAITGAWGVERTVGVTRAASEFVMPIQLVYCSKETAVGLFGSQWRSPQLESRLIPRAERVLEWQPPWGGGHRVG